MAYVKSAGEHGRRDWRQGGRRGYLMVRQREWPLVLRKETRYGVWTVSNVSAGAELNSTGKGKKSFRKRSVTWILMICCKRFFVGSIFLQELPGSACGIFSISSTRMSRLRYSRLPGEKSSHN